MTNWYILQAVGENREIFVEATRLLKRWAICRGIYGNLWEFNLLFRRSSFAIMVAYAGMMYKGLSLAGFIAFFFENLGKWVWTTPVSLHDTTTTTTKAPPCLGVLKPGTNEYCSSNVTMRTRERTRQELWRGYALTRDLSWRWRLLLEPFRYEITYRRFIKVRISVLEDELYGRIDFVR